ncbi:MAG: hypothetical protein ACYDH0_10170 [Candidatus Aminicenantales bacterium]
MHSIGVVAVSLLFSLFAPVTGRIERAFVRNDAGTLHAILSRTTALNISLPEPIGFSDQLSHEQAFFLMDRMFSRFKTFEFESEGRLSSLPGRKGCILKSRWSFRDVKNNGQYVFLVFFYLIPESSASGLPVRPERAAWKILEIKAERL